MNFKKELPSLALILVPFIYLGIIWSSLPKEVPIHWNALGEIDRYGSKFILLLPPLLMPGLIYLTFALIQRFTEIEKVAKMGKKLKTLKFLMVLFMSVLSMLIIHSSKEGLVGQPTFVFVSLGLLFTVLGNFFRTIQPNYFLGIRTPWTLKNVDIWKSTHELAGKLWFSGGILIALIALLSSSQFASFSIVLIIILIAIIPVIYSYLQSKKQP